MALQFQIVTAPFRFGIDEGIEPHQVPPGVLVDGTNFVWLKQGQIGKRWGTFEYPNDIIGGGTITAGERVFTRGSELCMTDGVYVYAWSSAANAWRRVDTIPEVGVEWENLLDTYSGVQSTAAALSDGGYYVHAWVSGDPTNVSGTGSVFVQVFDRASGARVLPPTVVDAATNINSVKVVIIGTTAIILYLVGATASIKAKTLDLTTWTLSLPTTLRSDVARIGWDARVVGSNFIIAYEYTGAAPKLKLYSYDASLVQQATGGITSEMGSLMYCVSIDGVDGEPLYVAYYSDSAVQTKVATADPTTLTEILAPVVAGVVKASQQVSVCRYDASSCIVAYTTNASGVLGRTTSINVTAAGTTVATSEYGTWGATIVARPFVLGSKCYLPLLDFPLSGTASQFNGANTFLVELAISNNGAITHLPHRLLGKIDPSIGGLPINGSHPDVVPVSATEAIYPSFFHASIPTTVSTWRLGLRLVTVTIGPSLPKDMWSTVSWGQDTYIGAGILSPYDGRSIFDHGFLRSPIWNSSIQSSPAGAVVAGAYLYGFGLEYRAATGTLHRSPIGTTPAGYTVAFTPSQVAHTLTGTSVSSKQDLATGLGASNPLPVIVAMFRSVKDGTVMQRLTFEPAFNLVVNNPLSQTQSLTDTRADASIDGAGTTLSSRPACYIETELDDVQPPGLLTQFLSQDRLWLLDGSGRTFWYSKRFTDSPGVAPGFNEAFRFSFEEKMTGGAAMDEKTLFFSATSVFYMLGIGPAPDGSGSDWEGPFRIQTDAGCTNARSIVSMPLGVMYQSERGLYLCGRQLEIEWIGRQVQDKLAAYPNITSAVLVAKSNQVRFTASNADLTESIVLVFDYVERQWTASKYTQGGVYGAPIKHACLDPQGVWTCVFANGRMHREDQTTYLDAGADWVPLDFTTAWMAAAGPLGFVSVANFMLTGVSHSNHDLAISVGFDGEATFAQGPRVFLAGSDVVGIGPLENCQISIGKRRKCSSIRFRVTDATPTDPGTYPVGNGRGASFDHMGIEVGASKGLRKISATRRG